MAELQAALADYGVWVLFLLAMIEGPLVVLGATALSQMGVIDIRLVWGIAVLADLAGDSLLYLMGRHLPDCLPARHRPHLARTRAETMFETSGARIRLLAKLTHFAGLPTLIAAGFGRMPFAGFLFWNLVGTLPKVTVIVLVGWLFWQTVLQGDTETATALLLTLAAAAGATLLYRRRRRSG